jgi:hypothetical protein
LVCISAKACAVFGSDVGCVGTVQGGVVYCGAVLNGAELGLGLDAGDAFRAVGGLTLGYLLRLGIKIEQLVRERALLQVKAGFGCIVVYSSLPRL